MILYSIKEFISWEWQVQLIHTLREGNGYEYLAKHEVGNDMVYQSFVKPLVGIMTLLLPDASGIVFSS